MSVLASGLRWCTAHYQKVMSDGGEWCVARDLPLFDVFQSGVCNIVGPVSVVEGNVEVRELSPDLDGCQCETCFVAEVTGYDIIEGDE